MNRLGWGRNATKATPKDGIEVKNPKRQMPRDGKSHGGLQEPPSSPRLPKSRDSIELHLDTKRADFDLVADGWVDSAPPPRYSQIPVDIWKSSATGTASTSLTTQQPFPQLSDTEQYASVAADMGPAVQSYQSFKTVSATMPRRQRKESCSSTSTIFESSPSIPITIIVTTPDEEFPPLSELSTIRGYFPSPSEIQSFRNDSTMSLPSVSSKSPAIPRQFPDRSRLMPPLDPQLDSRKVRKAREFEEVKRFLIGFLNTKGDQFPRKLRVKLMSLYGIRDGDLDPQMVSKFDLGNKDIQDEGIVLEHGLQFTEGDSKDHLRVLEMAFKSIMPTISPHPHPAHEILAARRKRMSMPLNSNTPINNELPFQKPQRMSLNSNTRTKTTLDEIINKHAAYKSRRQSAPALQRSSTVISLPAKLQSKSTHVVVPPNHRTSTESKSRRGSVSSETGFRSSIRSAFTDSKSRRLSQPVIPTQSKALYPPLPIQTQYKPPSSSSSQPSRPSTSRSKSAFSSTSQRPKAPILKTKVSDTSLRARYKIPNSSILPSPLNPNPPPLQKHNNSSFNSRRQSSPYNIYTSTSPSTAHTPALTTASSAVSLKQPPTPSKALAPQHETAKEVDEDDGDEDEEDSIWMAPKSAKSKSTPAPLLPPPRSSSIISNPHTTIKPDSITAHSPSTTSPKQKPQATMNPHPIVASPPPGTALKSTSRGLQTTQASPSPRTLSKPTSKAAPSSPITFPAHPAVSISTSTTAKPTPTSSVIFPSHPAVAPLKRQTSPDLKKVPTNSSVKTSASNVLVKELKSNGTSNTNSSSNGSAKMKQVGLGVEVIDKKKGGFRGMMGRLSGSMKKKKKS